MIRLQLYVYSIDVNTDEEAERTHSCQRVRKVDWSASERSQCGWEESGIPIDLSNSEMMIPLIE